MTVGEGIPSNEAKGPFENTSLSFLLLHTASGDLAIGQRRTADGLSHDVMAWLVIAAEVASESRQSATRCRLASNAHSPIRSRGMPAISWSMAVVMMDRPASEMGVVKLVGDKDSAAKSCHGRFWTFEFRACAKVGRTWPAPSQMPV